MQKNKKKNISEAINLINSDLGDIFITEIENSIGSAIEKAQGKQYALIESAVVLNNEEKLRIEKVLVQLLKKEIKIVYRLKPSLLAGLYLKVGDWVIDGSLSYQIDKLKETIGGQLK